jgi:hypothetical protein
LFAPFFFAQGLGCHSFFISDIVLHILSPTP